MSEIPVLPRDGRSRVLWRGLAGAGYALEIARAAERLDRPLLLVARDAATVARLEDELRCFSGIGVGLMPLEDTPWARSKCAFKAIQYMALGIPAVASPVGMNVEVIRDGESGFLPADAAGWVRAIDALLADPALAARVGAEGRRTVERDYSLEVAGKRLTGFLAELV